MQSTSEFPFRVGTTSYIIPDDIIPNIEYLKNKVDDVEIVLFESHEASNLPSADDIARLRETGEKHKLTYSIHLPLDVYLGNSGAALRERSVEKCRRVVESTQRLDPSAYVMHAEAGPGIDVNGFSAGEKRRFAENFHASLESLFSRISIPPSEFCIETLNYPLEILDGVIASFGLSVTLDIGHLELYGFSVQEHLDRYLDRTRVLHLHGIREGKDHQGLQHMRKETLDMVIRALHDAPDPKRVFTMEIFSEDDFRTSCTALSRYR